MRVKVEGTPTKERVIQVLTDLFMKEPNAEVMSNFNMYFTLRDSRGKMIEFIGEEGQQINTLVYREERTQTQVKKNAPPKTKKPTLRVVPNKAQNPPEAQTNAA